MIFYIQMKKVIKQRYFHFHLRTISVFIGSKIFKLSSAFFSDILPEILSSPVWLSDSEYGTNSTSLKKPIAFLPKL